MTAKRFRVNELVKYNYSEIGEYIDENHTDKPLRNDEVAELLNELHEENEQLKQEVREYIKALNKTLEEREELWEENEQLKQRNDRQAKRLAELYELMAKKDWESLTEIIDDFCSCEEQLQREWRTYE